MKTLMQRVAVGVATSTMLSIGYPASADEPARVGRRAGITLEDVAPARVALTDPTRRYSRGAPASAALPAYGAAPAVGQRASTGEPDGAQTGLAREGIILPPVTPADIARLDPRGGRGSAGRLALDAGGAQPDWFRAREDRDRRIGLGVLIGAGIGVAMGALVASSWCANEGGGGCPLTFSFGGLGALAGGGIGGVLGALGGK